MKLSSIFLLATASFVAAETEPSSLIVGRTLEEKPADIAATMDELELGASMLPVNLGPEHDRDLMEGERRLPGCGIHDKVSLELFGLLGTRSIRLSLITFLLDFLM